MDRFDEIESKNEATTGSRRPGSPSSPYRSRGRKHPLTATATLAALVIAAAGGYKLWNYLASYESTDDAQVSGHIAPISSRIDGTVTRVYVQDTQRIKAGQLLVEIDPRDYQVAADKALADLAQARAQVDTARLDYKASVARLHESEATNTKAQADADRYRALYERRVASRQDYEEQVRLAKVALATVESNRASVASAFSAIASRQATVESAKAMLDQAVLNLGYVRIAAPVTGIVGKKTVEAGERITPGQELMAIVPSDDIWVTANFKETQLRRMRPGQRATIHVDALGRDFNGYVEGMPGASGERYSLLPPENATGNYVKVVQRFPVRIRFAEGQDQEHRLRPGMSVEPTVWLR